MTDQERINLGLTQKLKYRYAYASGDIHSSGESGTYFLRALARMGVYLEKNEKYFTPDSIKEIKKKKENPNYQTNLINPIYISDHQVPLEYAEIETIGGEALYDYEEEPPIFLGFAPKTEIKNIKREAERKLSPPGAKFGLEGGGGTADNTIPKEGTSSDIKKLTVKEINVWRGGASIRSIEVVIELLGVSKSYPFDNLGFITVNGIKYSAVQLIDETKNISALKYLQDLKDADVNLILESWGLVEEGKKEETDQEELPDREDDKSNPNEPGDDNVKPEEVAQTTNTSSITETISILRGWKTQDGKVVYKKNGTPEKTKDKSPQLSISDSAIVEIGSDGSINITGDVQINVADKKDTVHLVKDGKFTIKFGKITGNFKCQKVSLTSLANSPKTVTGTFDCSQNKLTTLSGGPESVGIFIAHSNTTLTSLAGGPKIINGITDTSKSQKEHIYDVSSCGLTSLDGNGITTFGPGGFNCAANKLTALSGLDVVSSAGVTKFDCSKNLLTSLVGIPNSRKDTKTGKSGDYNISGNVDIKTFPASMANLEVDEFRASGLSLTSLSFAPKQVYGNFDCTGNKGSTKLTNQTIGKDRFKIGGGFEEDAGNRIVKIDGAFISSEGSWSDKTYDINTVFKSAEVVQGGTAGAAPIGSGNVGGVSYITRSGKTSKVWLQQFNPSTLSGGYAAPVPVGKNQVGNQKYKTELQKPGTFVQKGFKNFINAGPFEDGGNPTWAPGPNGWFFVNGRNYGTKVDGGSTDIHPKNSDMRWCPLVVLNPAKTIIPGSYDIVAKKGSYDAPALTVKGIGKIITAIPMYNICISDNQVKKVNSSFEKYSGWPFIGILSNGNWFAGCSDTTNSTRDAANGWNVPEIAQSVLSFWNQKGIQVKKMAGGDGGGSTKLYVNGQKVGGMAEDRAIATILSW